MSFTDHELERLKERLNFMRPKHEMKPSLEPIYVLDLIARLEAAEAYINQLQKDGELTDQDLDVDQRLYEAWLKSKGEA